MMIKLPQHPKKLIRKLILVLVLDLSKAHSLMMILELVHVMANQEKVRFILRTKNSEM